MKDETERLMMLLRALGEVMMQVDPKDFGGNQPSEYVQECVEAWESVNIVSGLWLNQVRAARRMPPAH